MEQGTPARPADAELLSQEAERLEGEVRALPSLLLARVEAVRDVAHDLRTPLSAILGAAELVRDGLLGSVNEDQHARMNDIVESAMSILQVVERRLAPARVEAEALLLEPAPCPLAAAVSRVVQLVGPRAEASGVALQVSGDAAVASADPARLRQLLFALVTYAIDATPRGSSVALEVRQGNGAARVVVRDGAALLPSDLHELLLRRPRRKDPEKAPDPRPALARQLAEAMGGGLVLEAASEGNEFVLALPAV